MEYFEHRFGYNYLEHYIKDFGATIEVVDGEEPQTLQEELVKDLISIMSSFSARLYGSRSAQFKRRVKDALKECQANTQSKRE